MLVLAAAVLARAQTPPAYDIVFRHGTIVDGTGAPRYQADIAIAGGSIARIGRLGSARGAVDVDASGLYVAPGFINIHSHATADGLPVAANMLTQGVTTEILNADGSGPIAIDQQLAALSGRGLAVNVGVYIGFNSIWSQVIGAADRRASADDIAKMRALLTDGLASGAWGVSAGLDYKPAYFAQLEEVIRVVDAAAPWRTNFTNHDRVTPESGFSSRAGMAETIAIGERASVTPIITHMKVQGHEQGTSPATLDEMRRATARGRYTAADAYPYLAGQTSLAALIIPGWAQDGGRDAMLKRFADPAARARIVAEAEQAMDARFGGAHGVYLPATKRELTDVMRELRVSAGEAVVRILEQGNTGVILRFGAESDLVKILQNPTTSIACDCGSVAGDAAHPRYYGSFPRVLGRYVREQHALTWEDAIRKMTGLPATTIGMVDRGFLAAGMAADVTVFDPAAVLDHATFEEPTLPSDGVRFVVINGRFALRDGTPAGEQAGRALKRSRSMPTRPMDTDVPRRLDVHGRVEQAQLKIDLEQRPGAPSAKGSFTLSDPRSNVKIEMRDLGLLQRFGDWASFTGRGKLRSDDDERSVTVIVDGSSIRIDAGDGYQLAGELRP